ncbi:MAG: glycosyltransferase family 2 protein [Faecousia sp.]
MSTISVIVPVYKVEAYLRRCVDSILVQSFPEFDLILVDDGSPDSCGAICEEYTRRDSRVRVIHQKNGGLSAARNTGIDWAQANSDSRWLAFVDSDDWVHPDFLRQLYDAVTQTGCKVSACGIFRTGGEDFPAEVDCPCRAMPADDFYCSGVIHDGLTAVAWNKLYHKSLFAALRYPVGKLHEDQFTTYLAVYAAGTVAVLDKKLYAYYQNPQGIMRSGWKPGRMDALEAFEQQIAYAEEKNNSRLLCKAAEEYLYLTYEHLKQVEALPQYRRFLKPLRKKLRQGMKLGKRCRILPELRAQTWLYEAAYPATPFWWLWGKLSREGEKRG